MAKKTRSTSVPAARATRAAVVPLAAGRTGVTGRQLAWWCLRLLVLLVPLAITNITWSGASISALTNDQFELPKLTVMLVLSLAGVGAWAFDLLRHGGAVRRSPVFYALAGLLGWVVLSTLFSISPRYAVFGQYMRLEGLVTFVAYALVFFLGVQLVDSSERAITLARWLAVGATISAIYGLIQYLGLDPLKWGQLTFESQRAFGTFGNPDPLGGFLVLVLPITAALALSETANLWVRLAWWAAFLLLGVVLLATFTRGAWVGGTLALAVFAFGALRARVPLRRGDLAPAALAVAGAGAVVVRSARSESAVTNVVARLSSVFEFGTGSGYTRTLIWRAALRSTGQHPVLGSGPDTFRLTFAQSRSPLYVRAVGHASIADNAHSYPLQLASTLGVPGALLFYVTVGWALALSARTAFKREGGTSRIVMTAMWAGVVGYLAHLLFGVTAVGSTVIMWVLLAVLVAPSARVSEVTAPRWGRTGSWVVAAVAALLVCAAFVPAFADNAFVRGLSAPDPESAVGHYRTAVRLAPWNDRYVSRLATAERDIMLQSADEVRGTGDAQGPAMQRARDAFTLAERDGLRALDLAPGDLEHPAFLVNLYTRAALDLDPANMERAIGFAQEALRKNALAAEVRYELAAAYATSGKLADAEREAQKAADGAPTWAEPRILLGDVYKSTRRLAEARASYRKALELPDPTVSASRRAQVEQSLASVEASLSAGGN